ncbi:MAG: Flp pilus assembly complex ATPase component TadA [Candidatus Krumholzibacteria bacterium]|nr:Flp pilus assembly complex ATPase component TadA [Candidatus Krumholzibacteria bacterium]
MFIANSILSEGISARASDIHIEPKAGLDIAERRKPQDGSMARDMGDEQAETLIDCGNQSFGMIIFVGQTGSGKSTSVYSLLSQIDTETRSLMSVEDPVEYRIPSANQQQVNEKAGVTFNALLKSSVRQDPDIPYGREGRNKGAREGGCRLHQKTHQERTAAPKGQEAH